MTIKSVMKSWNLISDNIIYNDSPTSIGMTTLIPYVTYEPLMDDEKASLQHYACSILAY